MSYSFTNISWSYKLTSALLLLLFFISSTIFCEEPAISLLKIRQRMNYIKSASNKFYLDYKLLSAIIFVERTLNYDWEDDALDIILARSNINSSIGFCQVKLKTAYWIEGQLEDSTSIFYPGKKYKNLLIKSKNKEELISNLSNDSLNIIYASAYLRIIQSRWQKAGHSINNRPEIIGTLYSTGLFFSDGKERKPNENPKSNEFGRKVIKEYYQLNFD